MKKDFTFREIPYNYTSFSDREIVLRYFDEETWEVLDRLRNQRVTGRSARLLFEIFGDFFVIDRNPYIFDDLLKNRKKRLRLKKLHRMRLGIIEQASNNNALVLEIIRKTRELDEKFFDLFEKEKGSRKRIASALGRVTPRGGIHFSPFHRIAHVTDASDWRVEYPAVVVYPGNVAEVMKIVQLAAKLGLKIIPRGGGTGLTGGAVPVYRNTMVINLEKLGAIGDIGSVRSGAGEIPVIEVEAGAVTEDVIEHCRGAGYIFATDPTSAWASTIGGNIAENAGGKKAVMWGTAIDNIHSFRIINAGGDLLEVRRRDHPYRKIEPADQVIFDVYHIDRMGQETLLKSILLEGTEIRKRGLGKDVTNKALRGIPGIQKEGGDGIIVSARFILFRPFQFCRTMCLEFFGNNLINASKAIVDIMDGFGKSSAVCLTALEHFDEKYVRAINYRNKSKRAEIPKAVLLIDMESNEESLLVKACEDILRMTRAYNTEGVVASDEAGREIFWKERKNLGAIARHTNAFKLNEDIVIPMERLPLFADLIEKLNLQKELSNNIAIIADIDGFLKPLAEETQGDLPGPKIHSFLHRMRSVREVYRECVENLDRPARELFRYQSEYAGEKRSVFRLVQEGTIKISFDEDIISNFHQTFHGYEDLLERFNAIVENQRKRKIILATHMHAGDGNVHVNIPVHSSDYLMMQEADETAGTVMREVVGMDGVVSGEHGIGLTKLRFIGREVLDEYARYKGESDPGDLFNPGKLTAGFPLSRVYTPSFNLLELEAFILKATDLERLSTSIAMCVRCGKCKGVCNTHYPGGTMFYNPRNKILSTALIVEAVLYDAQTANTLSFRNFKMLRDIADHCTVCHKCQLPCPVRIDFGAITLSARELLKERKKTRRRLVTGFTLFYLREKGYYINKLFRILLLRMGYSLQRAGFYLNRPVSRLTSLLLPRAGAFLQGRLPDAGRRTLRESLGLKGINTFFSFQNPAVPVKKSIIYFPGCGSERMFPEISMAVIALLYRAGVRVVIPPEFLCCGYPMLANGRTKAAEIRSYENRVMFHRIADTVGYMDIGAILVSCGTCMEMLEKYDMDNIFRDAALMDVSEFIAREKLYRTDSLRTPILYHDPCHSPLKKTGHGKVFVDILGVKPAVSPYCCGEGGTLALSTPEISNLLRARKGGDLPPRGKGEKTVVLTTCPSCVQGLSKIGDGGAVAGKALAVFLAEEFLGEGWEKDFLKEVHESVERILF